MNFTYKHAIKATAGIALASVVQAEASIIPGLRFDFETFSSTTYAPNTNFTQTVGGVGVTFNSDSGSYSQFVTGTGTGTRFSFNSYGNTESMTFTFNRAVDLTGLYWNAGGGSSVTLSVNNTNMVAVSDQSGTFDLSNMDRVTTLTISGNTLGNDIDFDDLIFQLSTVNYEADTRSGGGNSPAQLSGRLLDSVVTGGNNSMSGLFTALNSLSTNAQVAAATDALAPVATNASVQAGNQIANNIQNIVELRQEVSMSGGLNSGDSVLADSNLWIKPFATRGEQDDKNGFNGFDFKARGFGIGMDKEYKGNQLGLAFFYTTADVDVNHVSQNAGMDVYTVLLYGSTPVIDSKTSFMYQAGYAWQNTKTTRNFNFGGLYETANSDFTSKTASLDLKLARQYKIDSSLVLRPIVELTYRNYQTPAYSETGATTTNQRFGESSSSELIASLGTMADYMIDKNTKVIGNVNIGYDLRNDQQNVSYSYVGDASGASATSSGIDNGRWEYKAGIGIERAIDEGSNINIMIDHKQEGSTFKSDTISAKYVYKF